MKVTSEMMATDTTLSKLSYYDVTDRRLFTSLCVMLEFFYLTETSTLQKQNASPWPVKSAEGYVEPVPFVSYLLSFWC